MSKVRVGEATIAEVKQPTCMDGLEVIPANINLTGAEIELIGNDRREYILQEAKKERRDGRRDDMTVLAGRFWQKQA